MAEKKMHADEVHTDETLVRRLLAGQFPHWADLPIERISSSGTDHAIYRLGEQMAVRLPRIHWATGQADKEDHWLPILSPHLPLDVPVPLAKGRPAEGYPWRWSVVPWLEGEAWTLDGVDDLCDAARALAQFILALQQIDTTGGPPGGRANGYRGVPLSVRDADMRRQIAAAGDMVDATAMIAAWERALAAPEWEGAPVWVHGDLSRPGNLLVSRGRLSGVIDFGCLGVGDPASDLTAAWALFSGESRAAFRAALPFDDATWERARGWTLIRVGGLAYYRHTNPPIVAESLHDIEEALADRT